jgi:inorganic phosphate transporter, PiT family
LFGQEQSAGHGSRRRVLTIATAVVFEFTNGFHDTANATATTTATRALKPRIAVGRASILNFAGAFISITIAASTPNAMIGPMPFPQPKVNT